MLRSQWWIVLFAFFCRPMVLLSSFMLLVSSCATLPKPPEVAEVNLLPAATSGVLAEAAQQVTDRFPAGKSGFVLLSAANEALHWRLALISQATSAIDIQSFIWQDDETGALLIEEILRAAERGVRVRLLLDDFTLAVKDAEIRALSQVPNLEVKIFNPGRVRDSALGYYGEFLLSFRQLNRRMHNKLFVVDGHAAIVGGRNLGNPYFGLSEEYNFRDQDVLTVGPVVTEINQAFDYYWNSPLAYPGNAMAKESSTADLQAVHELAQAYLADEELLLAEYAAAPQAWRQRIQELPDLLLVGEGHFLQDEPDDPKDQQRLAGMLDELAAPAHKEMLIVTPYMIPVGGFLDHIKQLSAEGVKIKILTGSLGSNNSTLAHSHYKKYRRLLLSTGAELYEFRHDPSAEIRATADVAPVTADFISLHVKAIVGDRQRCFIGSLNLDPRAMEINTENGLYIDSRDLCGQLADDFDRLMSPENAWRVTVNDRQVLVWEAQPGRVTIQPARNFWQRVKDGFYRLLPIESQL